MPSGTELLMFYPSRISVRRALSVGASLIVAFVLVACGDDGPTGLATESCSTLPYFSVMPVQPSDLDFTSVFGGLGAPGHTLPTAHTGLFLQREGVPVVSPGRIQIDNVRRVTYTTSPNRQGERDYAISFSVCEGVEGWFGHLTSLAPGIPDNAAGAGCETYPTSLETVEACTEILEGFVLEAGEALGTAGLSISRGFLALDFGLLDRRVENFYLSPARHPDATFHAVCPYDYFDAASRDLLLGAIHDASKPSEVPTGEPRCGTMEVDVAGTAKGVWADPSETGPLEGDETRYITLADYPYNPQTGLALSLGPTELGARVAVVGREVTGRVNRAFEGVTVDGLIYCYNTPDPTDFGFGSSWLLSMPSGTSLEIERVEHLGASGPCDEDPASWTMGTGALTLVR